MSNSLNGKPKHIFWNYQCLHYWDFDIEKWNAHLGLPFPHTKLNIRAKSCIWLIRFCAAAMKNMYIITRALWGRKCHSLLSSRCCTFYINRTFYLLLVFSTGWAICFWFRRITRCIGPSSSEFNLLHGTQLCTLFSFFRQLFWHIYYETFLIWNSWSRFSLQLLCCTSCVSCLKKKYQPSTTRSISRASIVGWVTIFLVPTVLVLEV